MRPPKQKSAKKKKLEYDNPMGSSSQEIPNKTAEIEVEDGEENNLAQPLTFSHTPKSENSRRHTTADLPKRQMSAAFGQLTNILTKIQNERTPPPKEYDNFDIFSKLLAKKLRELPPDDRKLFMYDIDTLFINRIKERLIRRQTPLLSPIPVIFPSIVKCITNFKPSFNPQTSYSEPLPNTSPIPSHPSTSQTSHSESLRNTSPIPSRPSTSQPSYPEPLPNTSPIPSLPSTSTTSYSTSTSQYKIQIITSDEVPLKGQNIISEALLKAYQNLDSYEKLIYTYIGFNKTSL
ncbi:unnamed protein product [Parnassius mnemosyne]|uniref:BESS domain-containing protein n=1 Tax=Parnassius mnemosyne TaxID=213953 RepID=A0AAV1KXD9_9NEOP